MKYLVMECHPGYAVLMDEESRFVRAANLHYTVGQTVTNPVLMQEKRAENGIHRNIIMQITAAAACLLLVGSAAFGFYSRYRKVNTPAESVVVLVEQTRYEMQLNKDGNVIYIAGEDSDKLNELLQKDKQKLPLSSVFSSLLQDSISRGTIDDSQTVEIYLSANDAASYSEYKEQLETEAAKLQLNADVKGMEEAAKPAEKAPDKPETVKPQAEPSAPKEPQDSPKPAPPAAPAAPAAPPAVPDENPEHAPAAHPKEDKQEPPAPAEPPAEPVKPERPDAEHPVPPAEAEIRPDEAPLPGVKPPHPLPEPVKPAPRAEETHPLP